jgi:predicted nucleotidyltransferase
MLQKSSMLKIENLFFMFPTKDMYLIQISKDVKIAHTSVKNNLKKLLNQGIIIEKIEKKGKRNYPVYRASIDSKEYRKYKKLFNYSQIIESGLIKFLEDNIMPRSIVLFGSYQKGEDIEDSDIDLFLESSVKEIDLSKFQKILKRNIQIHFNDNINSYPKELKNNIINGIVLSGYLEVFK